MIPQEPFEAILAAARTGAEWALVELYRDLHPRVLRYLRTMEPSEAEDLASEAWIDVAAGLGRFEGDERAFRSWGFTIARRRLVDLRRQRGRRNTVPLPREAIVERAGTGNVEEEAMTELGTEEALARIATLPPDQAEVVLLRVLAGLDSGEVARILGKRPGAVRVLQHRALRRLAGEIPRESVTE
ncbi:MAG: RNA polymerase sigma factor [Actinobacteria bacterium]|nr:RNA polymerase sigma factor [Actinomycetota bacterium]